MKRALTKRLWLFAVTCLTVQALAQSTTQSLPNQPRPQQKGSVAAYATPKLGSATGAIPCEGPLESPILSGFGLIMCDSVRTFS